MVQPLCRNIWRFLKKLNIELPNDLAVPPLGIYAEKAMHGSKGYMHPSVHCSTIYNSQETEAN